MRKKVSWLAVCMVLLAIFAANYHLVQTPEEIALRDQEGSDDEEAVSALGDNGTRSPPGWSEEKRLTYTSGDSTTPDMAVWGSNVHVVWSEYKDGNSEIFYKRSIDGGQSWGSNIRLTFTNYGRWNPKIAVHENNIHIVWWGLRSDGYYEYVYYAKSTDNGESWGDIVELPYSSHNPIFWPDIALEGNNVYIVAIVEGWDIYFKRSFDNGNSWSEWMPTVSPGWSFPMPSIETGGGLIHVVYKCDAGSCDWIDHFYSEDQGDTWIEDIYNPVVLADSGEGEILYCFATSMDGSQLYLAYSMDCWDYAPPGDDCVFLMCWWKFHGGEWSGPSRLNDHGGITVDTDKGHVVWDETDEKNHRQLFSNKWGQLTDSPSDSYMPAVGSSGGIIHMVWVDNRNGNNELYYCQRGVLADLAISNSDIKFAPADQVEKDTTAMINAHIFSYGKSASNVEVKFYNGDPDTDNDGIPDPTAIEIGSDNITINKDASTIASVQWIPTLVGIYNIYVWADPYNNIQEYKYGNNLANKTLRVFLVDFTVYNSGIQFVPLSPIINDTTVTISASIFSQNNSKSDVVVKFYSGNPDLNGDRIPDLTAIEIGNDTIDIDKDSSALVSIQWIPPSIGTHSIYVWVDALNTTWESNELNNLANDNLVVFHWLDTFNDYSKTGLRQNIDYLDGDAFLYLPNHFNFDTSDEGFILESNQPNSRIYWDAGNQRVGVISDRQDSEDEIFSKTLPYVLTPDSESWTLTARWGTTQRGNWQSAFPLFISESSTDDVLNDPNTIYILYGSGDSRIGVPSPGYRLRYRAGDGILYIDEKFDASPYAEYHFYISYKAPSKNLTMEIRDINDTTLLSTSYIIGTNPGDDFTIGKIGVASDGKSQSSEPNIHAWTDDINFGIHYEVGTLVSKPITLPSNKAWSTLYLDKTEPSDTFVKVTILDFVTGETIPGFMDLTGNIIDLTGLDPISYPSIKLAANFTGNVTTSPKLHYWAIDWDTLLFSLPLYKGWNLVSIPLIQSNASLQTVLQSIDGHYDSVQWYDPTDTNDHWKFYHISKSHYMNDLYELDHKMGFWLHVTTCNGTTLILDGTRPTSDQNIHLHPGWNLVGYPATINRLRDDALNNLIFGEDVDSMWTYDSTMQGWVEVGESHYLELGRGYWVHAKRDCNWIVFSMPPILNLNDNLNYPTIQEAIDEADPFDTIEIPPGTYNEELVISKPIILLGENNQTCVIKGNNNPVIKITADDVTISNLNLSGGKYGVYVTDSKDVKVLNSVIPDFKLICIYAYNSSITISSNQISEDPIRTGGAGIRLIGCKDSIIEYNTISDIVYSVYLMHSSAIIRDNVISPTDGFDDRQDSIGIALYHDSNATAIDNVINGGDVGIGVEYESFPIVERNAITGSEYYGILIKNSGSPILNDNTIEDCIIHGIFSEQGTSVGITNTTLVSDDILLCNSTIDNLRLIGGSATAINTSVINYQVDDGDLTVQWNMRIRVIDSYNNPIYGATVEVKDNSNGTFHGTYITDSDGRVRSIVVTEFRENEIEKIYYTPHNITASIGPSIGYLDPEPWMDASKEVVILLKDFADWIYVDDNNTGDEDGSIDHPFNTIQEALEYGYGSKIFVFSGDYDGPVRITESTIIKGEGWGTIVHGGPPDDEHPAFWIEGANNVTLRDIYIVSSFSEGIRISGSTPYPPAVKSTNINIFNCRILGATYPWVDAYDSSHIVIDDTTFEEEAPFACIRATNTDDFIIRNSEFWNIEERPRELGGGIILMNNSHLTIINTEFAEDEVWISDDSTLTIQ